MNLYHLKYFYDSARFKSISRAARLNSVGQPAVTKAIQNLEGVFKRNLLTHSRNRFHLTDEGEKVYSLCHKIFSATDELMAAVQNDLNFVGEVGLACTSSMAECDFLVSTIKKLSQRHPELKLRLSLGRTDLVRDWIKAGKADIGIVLDNIDLSEFETEVLARGHYSLVCNRNYKGNWHEEGVMTVEAKREVLELHSRYKSVFGRPLKTKMEIGSWTVIKRFVQAGSGVGFVPNFMVQDQIKKQKLIQVEAKRLAIPYEIKVIRDPRRYYSSKNKTVIQELVESSRG